MKVCSIPIHLEIFDILNWHPLPYKEVNTKCNLPAQVDLLSTKGDAYEFILTKGGGSANKTHLFQKTKALLNPSND